MMQRKSQIVKTLVVIVVLSSLTMSGFGISSMGATEKMASPLSCEQQSTAAETLFCSIAARESLMKDVAAIKFGTKSPYDAKRELRVLKNSKSAALEAGLPPREIQLYAQILMDLSKQIQAYWFLTWDRKHVTPQPSLTLEQIRDRIIRIDGDTISAIAMLRRDNPISSKSQLAEELKRWLSDIEGIHPDDDPDLFADLLAEALWVVLT